MFKRNKYMIVKDLINKLQTLGDDLPVVVNDEQAIKEVVQSENGKYVTISTTKIKRPYYRKYDVDDEDWRDDPWMDTLGDLT